MSQELATILHVEGFEYKTLPINCDVSVTGAQWACNIIEEAGDTATTIICGVDNMNFKPYVESVGRKLTLIVLPNTVIKTNAWAVAGSKTIVWSDGA